VAAAFNCVQTLIHTVAGTYIGSAWQGPRSCASETGLQARKWWRRNFQRQRMATVLLKEDLRMEAGGLISFDFDLIPSCFGWILGLRSPNTLSLAPGPSLRKRRRRTQRILSVGGTDLCDNV
jgi:hypothetical protein